MRSLFVAFALLATPLIAQDPTSLDVEIELVERSFLDRLNPWSEERKLSRQWKAGLDTPEVLNLETLVLDEAHSFLLFDPVPERLSRKAASQWFTVGTMYGTANLDINASTFQARATNEPLALVLRRAIEREPGPNTFWTASNTYEFRLNTDILNQNGQTGHSSIYYSQGWKLTAPVPWGGTSLGLDAGFYGAGGMIDEDFLFNQPYRDWTSYLELGGYMTADVYQQVIRDWFSIFGQASCNFGGLMADNDAPTFQGSQYRLTTSIGGGFEVRIWRDPNLTARVFYAATDSEDELRTFVTSAQMYSLSLNF